MAADERSFDGDTARDTDKGYSSLINGERRPKDNIVFQVLGDLDELNSYLGWIKAQSSSSFMKERIECLQKVIFRIGAMAATPTSDQKSINLDRISDHDLLTLEIQEKSLLQQVEIPNQFILPGGSSLSSLIDVCRAVCRRAERSLVSLIRSDGMQELATSQQYLNKMSYYLYLLARWEEQKNPGLESKDGCS